MGIELISDDQQPFAMNVDRPSFFAVRDNLTATFLFMGCVVDP